MLHHEIVEVLHRAEIVEGTDVRVIEAGDRPRLPSQALACLRMVDTVRGQQLESDVPVQAGIAREIDPAHTAAAQQGHHLVRTDTGAELHAHVRSIIRTATHVAAQSDLISTAPPWPNLASFRGAPAR